LTFVVEVDDRVGCFDGMPGGGKAGGEAVGYVFFVFFVFEGEAPYKAFLRWRGVQGFDVE
jgi:hypothetical protein